MGRWWARILPSFARGILIGKVLHDDRVLTTSQKRVIYARGGLQSSLNVDVICVNRKLNVLALPFAYWSRVVESGCAAMDDLRHAMSERVHIRRL